LTHLHEVVLEIVQVPMKHGPFDAM
jgi:hypothetical protein